MSKRIISVSLSEDSIAEAIRTLENYKRELTDKIASLVEALTDHGVKIAKAQVRALGASYTGELEDSITGYFSPTFGVGVIKAGAPYAVYVEFGTGVVGESKPHPKAGDFWEYDINEHGESGWVYYNNRDQKWHWTAGWESRPFMYNTVMELERDCLKIAKEVFDRD